MASQEEEIQRGSDSRVIEEEEGEDEEIYDEASIDPDDPY